MNHQFPLACGLINDLVGLEWRTRSGFAEPLQAVEIIAPVKIVCAVRIVIQLLRILLHELDGRFVVLRAQRKAECVVLPIAMAVDALPTNESGRVKLNLFHVRVKVPMKRESNDPTFALLDAGPGRPPTRNTLFGRQCATNRFRRSFDMKCMNNGFHLWLSIGVNIHCFGSNIYSGNTRRITVLTDEFAADNRDGLTQKFGAVAVK